MRLETRLKVSTVVSLVGITGLALMFYIFLPDQADEVLRRESESRLEKVSEHFVENIRNISEPVAETLERVLKDDSVLALLSENESMHDLAADVDLAKKLSRKYTLEKLLIIDKSSIVRSAWPEAARAGLKDIKLHELAKESFKRPVFIEVSDNKQSESVLSIAVAQTINEGELFLLGYRDVSKENLEDLAARKNASLVEVVKGDGKFEENEVDLKIIVIKNYDGARVAKIALKANGDEGKIIRMLLVRNIVMLAAPWVLLFLFLIIWVGWPSEKRKKG